VRDGYLGSQAPEGVRCRPPGYCTPSHEMHCHVEVPDAVAVKIMGFAWQQVGKPYDFRSILGFLIRRDWRERDSWFCSELVAYSFEQAGWPLLRTGECNRINPSSLSLSPLLIRD
jgi:uncharacterized protein YycO